jgi:DNA-binding transcriptional LysR family regulator
MNWDDLRAFLAVVESGGLVAAARRLGVNHATVQRRVGRLEAALGVRLFDRSPTGYVLTPAGEDLLGGSRDLEDRMVLLEARIAGRDLQLTGTVRLTTVDSIAETVLPRYLRSFREDYPALTVEVVVENRVLNLTRREADIALRPGPDPRGTMVGRRFRGMGFAVYAADDGADAWIAGDDSLQHLAAMQWLASSLGDRPVAVRCNSFSAMAAAAASGLGAAVLPRLLGDFRPEIVRGTVLPDTTSVDLWLLSHPEVRRISRVRVLLDHLAACLKKDETRTSGATLAADT